MLQLQKYELPPTPSVQPQTPLKQPFPSAGTGSSLLLKTPSSVSTPPKGTVKVSPPAAKTTAMSSLPVKPTNNLVSQKLVMPSPSQPTRPRGQPPLPAVKSSAGGQKQSPSASLAGVVKPGPVMSPVSSVSSSTGRIPVSTTAATTSSSTTAVKGPVQDQAVTQPPAAAASAASLAAQGLTLIRAPVQLPPGVQATMITNAQGIPVMRLQGTGIQGSSPVTLVTSQVSGTQLQGAAIVRMAAPISNPATSGTPAGTIVRLPMQSGGTSVQGTAVLKIPVTTTVQVPAGAGLTLATMAGTGGQTVIRQQLPVTVPANLPPGTQLKVGPQGQLTAIGPGGIPVQLALQNIKTQQVTTGLQIQQGTRLGTPTVVQLTGASPMKPSSTPVAVSTVSPMQKVTASQSVLGSNRPSALATAVLTASNEVVTSQSAGPVTAITNTTTSTPSVLSSAAVATESQVQKASMTTVLAHTPVSTKQILQVITQPSTTVLAGKVMTTQVSTTPAMRAVTPMVVSSTVPAISKAQSPPSVTSFSTTKSTIQSSASTPGVNSAAVKLQTIQNIGTAGLDTSMKPTTTSATVEASLYTPVSAQSVCTAARVAATFSLSPSSSLTQSSLSTATKSTVASAPKGIPVSGIPVVPSLTSPLVSTSISSSTPVAVVSPLITGTRPVTTTSGKDVSPAKMTISSASAAVTGATRPSQVTSATHTVNGGVGVRCNISISLKGTFCIL